MRIRTIARRVGEVISVTYGDYRANRSIRLGAGLAYYGMFAVVPLLTLAMALAAVIFDDEEVQAYLVDLLDGLLGEDEELAQTLVDEIDLLASSTSFGMIGVVTLVVAASLVFVAIQDAFNEIWKVPVRSGVVRFITRRLTAFLVVLGAAGLLIAGLVLQAAAGVVEHLIPGRTDAGSTALAALVNVGSLAALALAVGLLYKMLGPERLRWRPAAIGAGLVAIAMTIGTVLLAEYLSRWGSKSVPGAAAGFAFVLIWIYYQSQILLAGAHLVRVLDEDRRPDATAGPDADSAIVPPR